MRKRILWGGLVVAVVALIGLGLLRSHTFNRKPLRVFFTGETDGELEPCNCGGAMAGGLPARGGYLDAQAGPRLLLDIGCIGAGARDFEILRTEAALRAMKVMQYDAANVGEHELWLGRSELVRLSGVGVPFVSSNTVAENGAPVVNPFIMCDIGGLRVCVLGVVAADVRGVGPGLKVLPPRETLARFVPDLAPKSDCMILLADLERVEVNALADEFPELTLILFRGRGQSLGPLRVNRSTVASIYGAARYIGDLTLNWTDAHHCETTGMALLLDSKIQPSAAVSAACIGWYKEAIAGKTFDLAQNRLGWGRINYQLQESGNGYVGSEACRACHPKEYEKWSQSGHAHAMQALDKAGYANSPECAVCHTTGYAAQDGYRSATATPALAKVGCEDCHGRGEILKNGNCRGLARKCSEQTCRECHTPKQHPTFDYQTAWPKIEHSGR